MIITKSTLLAALGCLISISALGKDAPFAPVSRVVKERTQRDITWQNDLAARDSARAQARALLRKPVTPASAVQIALLNNPGLQASLEEIGLSYAELREARALSNPEVEFTAKFPDRSPRKPTYEWEIAQNFLSLLMLPLRTRVAREKLAAAQMRAAAEVIELVAETKSAYYRAVAQQQTLARQKTMLESQRASLDLMQKLHAAGNVTDLRLLQEQAEYSQLRLEIATTEAALRENREELNRLMGTWGAGTNWKLAWSELPTVSTGDVPLRGLETVAVGNRLDLSAARSELQSAARSIGLEKSFRFIGALDFGLHGENEADGLNLTGPAIRFELPIFNQGQARIARGEAQLRMAAAKFEQLAIDIRSTVRELRDRLLSKRDIARFYADEVIPTRRRITALTLVQYNAMLVGAFEAFTARREDLEAEKRLIEATRDYWITRTELERAVGGDLHTIPGAYLTTTLSTSEHKTGKPIRNRQP
jgi:outer membrane protein, heavy metal efflux system